MWWLIKYPLYLLVILWGGLALFAYRTAKKTIAKYRNIKDIEDLEKWRAFRRHDWNQWD